MRLGFGSDVGRLRKINEDAVWCGERLFVVADGMGGHIAGEIAARMALETVKSWLFPDRLSADVSLEESVEQAVLAANQAVYDRTVKEPRLHGMGTTLTLALVVDRRAIVGHVGDSRAYLVRDGALTQITHDHSVVAELLRSGGLSETEAHAHPYKNLLTRALGTTREVEIDVETIRLEAGDGVLLCTDGLTGVVSDDEIAGIIARAPDPQTAVDCMIAKANERGGPDNVTVVVALLEETRV